MIDFIHVANGICPVGQHRVKRLLPAIAALGQPDVSHAQDRTGPGGSDGVPGGFGGVGAAGRRGPPEGSVGKLVDLPPGLLLEPVVMPALRRVVVEMTHLVIHAGHT